MRRTPLSETVPPMSSPWTGTWRVTAQETKPTRDLIRSTGRIPCRDDVADRRRRRLRGSTTRTTTPPVEEIENQILRLSPGDRRTAVVQV